MTPYCSTEILVLLLSFQKPKQFLRWRRIWEELFPTFGISLKFGGRGGTGHSARAQDGLGGRRRQHSVCCHPPAPVGLNLCLSHGGWSEFLWLCGLDGGRWHRVHHRHLWVAFNHLPHNDRDFVQHWQNKNIFSTHWPLQLRCQIYWLWKGM